MVCFLPLLFADGQPTCLETMTEAQLAKFIPFMLQCCPGNEPGVIPPWWPPDIPFEFPLTSPDSRSDRWLRCLKELVCRCYSYYHSQHVLRFCARLAKLSPHALSIEDSPGGLVNIYNCLNSKLIVTFKKRNQVYDLKPPSSPHKSLLPRKPQGTSSSYQHQQQQHIDDIYLCNYCDEEFISCKNAVEHEVLCKGKPAEEQNHCDKNVNQEQVMRYFGLCPKNDPKKLDTLGCKRGTSLRLSSRSYSSIPISSPLGCKMLNNVVSPLPPQDILACIEHNEAFCASVRIELKPKRWPRKCTSGTNWSSTSRRKNRMVWSHTYSFNKWQRAERLKTIATGLTLQSRQFLKKCKPCYVTLERVPPLKPGFQYKSDGVNLMVQEKSMNSISVEPHPQEDETQPSLNSRAKVNSEHCLDAHNRISEISSVRSSTHLTVPTRSSRSPYDSVFIDLCSSDEDDVIESDKPALSPRRNQLNQRNPVEIHHPPYGISAVSSLTPWQASSLMTSHMVRENAQVPVSDDESSETDWVARQSQCSGNCGSDCLCTHLSCSPTLVSRHVDRSKCLYAG